MIKSVLARRLIYPLHERLLKRPIFACLTALEQSQWLSRQGMEQLQEKKLAELLKPAWRHCPRHRERMMVAGIDPEGRVSLAEDLRRLPTIERNAP